MTWRDSSVSESACERQLPQRLIHEDADISSNDKRNCNLSEYKCCARGELMSLPRIASKQEVVQKRGCGTSGFSSLLTAMGFQDLRATRVGVEPLGGIDST